MNNKIIHILVATALMLGSTITTTFAATQPLGTNISSTDGTIYTITQENNTTVRRPYTSAGAFLSFGFNSWGNVLPATTYDLTLPIGSFIPPRDGSIICSDRGTDKGTCYLITESKRAGFTSSEIFNKLGFDFKTALSGDVSFLNTSTNIDSDLQAHRPGTLVNKDGTVYFVSPTGLLGIPDWASLLSWGYSQQDIVPANSADRGVNVTGNLTTRLPGQISPNNSVTTPPVTTPSNEFSFENTVMDDGNSAKDYSFKFKVINGKAPYKYELTDISHPTGYMKIDSKTGEFGNASSGLKPLKGDWTVRVKVIDATGKSIQQNFNWQVNYDTRTWRTSTNYSGTTAKIRFQFSNTNFMSKTAVEINGQTYTTDDNGIVTLPVGSGQSMTVRYGWETKTFTTPIINTPAPTPTPTPTPIPPCTGVCA